jgi:hypothetical protein
VGVLARVGVEEMATDFVKSSRSFVTVTAAIDSLLVRTR